VITGGEARTTRVAVTAVLGVSAAVVVGLGLRFGHYALDSDSVAQQSILGTWLHLGHGVTYLPVDTWLLKFPVYAVVEPLPLAPSVKVLLETMLLDVVGYALLAVALLRIYPFFGIATRARDVVMPLAWVVTLSGGVGYYLSVMPNFRNIEIGLSYLLLSVAVTTVAKAPQVEDSWRRRLPRLVAVTVAMGLLWLDDPYFGLVMAIPAATLSLLAAWWRQDPLRRAVFLQLAG
jgi:hypothetical protein